MRFVANAREAVPQGETTYGERSKKQTIQNPHSCCNTRFFSVVIMVNPGGKRGKQKKQGSGEMEKGGLARPFAHKVQHIRSIIFFVNLLTTSRRLLSAQPENCR